jgi:hypothetical protein
MVQGNLFNEHTGKWKYTVQIDMRKFYDAPHLVEHAVKQAFRATPPEVLGVNPTTITGFKLVVLDPYHEREHPVMVTI